MSPLPLGVLPRTDLIDALRLPVAVLLGLLARRLEVASLRLGGGQRLCHLLERLLLGANGQERRHDPADRHHSRADQERDRHPPYVPGFDHPAEEEWPADAADRSADRKSARLRAGGPTMIWECERGCRAGGSKTYVSEAEASRYARAFDREDSSDLGKRAPLIGLFPLRVYRSLRRRS